jgi:hypothetical protein
MVWMALPFLVLPAMVVGGFALLFRLSNVGSPEWIRRIGSGHRVWRFNLWQVMAAVVVTALLLHAMSTPAHEGAVSVILLALLVLAWFVRTWCNEFVFLMSLRDEDFPGRSDKLIWAIVLMAFAPFSVWFFRSYRLAHWPQPKFVSVDYGMADEEPEGRTAAHPA